MDYADGMEYTGVKRPLPPNVKTLHERPLKDPYPPKMTRSLRILEGPGHFRREWVNQQELV